VNFEELHRLVVEWGEGRGIFKSGTVAKQIEKLREELEELDEANTLQDQGKRIDAIGDMMVVLTMIAHMIGKDLFTCYAAAYLEIRDRKGKMVDGAFVKEQQA
jgi:NTP pyrophosphatase (non-canonical NTP hydrolase)